MADAEFTHEGDRCSFETLVFLTGLETDPRCGRSAKLFTLILPMLGSSARKLRE
jgi:hypothetical protein